MGAGARGEDRGGARDRAGDPRPGPSPRSCVEEGFLFPSKRRAGLWERRALCPAATCSDFLTPEAPGSSRQATPISWAAVSLTLRGASSGARPRENGAQLRYVSTCPQLPLELHVGMRHRTNG